MDSLLSDSSSSRLAAFCRELQPRDGSAGQMTVGKQGVYLIDRNGKVASFELVRWQQLLSRSEVPSEE
jgi:hypothetical protein